jgi:hypothetical protein
MHSHFVKNHPIDLKATNPSFKRWFFHTSQIRTPKYPFISIYPSHPIMPQ